MANRRLTVSLSRKHAMMVTRMSLGKKKLVYVIQAQKPLKYPWGRSRIAYIGTTKKGIARFAQSAAAKADDVLDSTAFGRWRLGSSPVALGRTSRHG